MVKHCPVCNGELLLEDKVLFCSECLHVVNRDFKRDEIDESIRYLRQKGLSWKAISDSVGMSVRAVYRRFKESFGDDHPLLGDIPSVKQKKETTILAYILHVDEGLSYSKTAEMLDISISACKQKVFRERKRMGLCNGEG